jgi:UDP-glucose:glycoprotein glucosyltransferase
MSAIQIIEWLRSKELLREETSQEFYSRVFDRIEEIVTDNTTVAFMKASLANHEMAPSVQAFYHYYTENVMPGRPDFDTTCKVWIDWGGKQLCGPRTEWNFDGWVQAKAVPFDHYYKGRMCSRTAILYANVHAPEFDGTLEWLKGLATDQEDFNFALRFIPDVSQRKALFLNGFGVELDVKNTEYKVLDDRKVADEFVEDASFVSQHAETAEILYEKVPTIQKLTKDQIADIAVKAVTFASQSENRWNSLVRLSENFPKYAHLLLNTKANFDLHKTSISIMQTTTGEEQMMLLNGQTVDVDDLNVFKLLRMIREDTKTISQLKELGFSSSEAIDLLSSPLENASGTGWGESFNIHCEEVIWLNDLEKDHRYAQFPAGIDSILEPGHQNQFKYIRKNVFNVLFVVDFTDPTVIPEIFRLYQFLNQLVPFRFGILPFVPTTELEEHVQTHGTIAKALTYVYRNNPNSMQKFLFQLNEETKSDRVDENAVRKTFKSVIGKDVDLIPEDNLIQKLKKFALQFGVDENSAVFFNGKFSPFSRDWTKELVHVYFKMMSFLTEEVAMGKLTDNDSVYEYFLSLPHVYQTRNPFIFGRSAYDVIPINFMDLIDYQKALLQVKWLNFGSPENHDPIVSLILITNLSSDEGEVMALNSLKLNHPKVRLAFLDNGSGSVAGETLSAKVHSLDTDYFAMYDIRSKNLASFVNQIPSVTSSSTTIVINGRVIGPVSGFTTEDFQTLIDFELQKRISNIANMIKAKYMDLEQNATSDLILKCSGVLSAALTPSLAAPKKRRYNANRFLMWDDSPVTFSVGDFQSANVQLVAVVQPITSTGQKVLSLLDSLKNLPSVAVKVVALATLTDSEKPPLNRFYRFQFGTEPQFKNDGTLKPPKISFARMPDSALLTLGLDVPNAWLVRPKKSIHDLDNIKLSLVPEGHDVDAEFSLQSLLVQGHASDTKTHGPPRGLQFILGTDSNPAIVDTITMANLGYLQLKGGPGVWNFKIRPGRSDQVYTLKQVDQLSTSDLVVVDSFEGRTIYPMVSKKAGMETEDVLLAEGEDANPSLWNQIKTS